jgi:beta-glucanase (GH16 family)
LAPKHHTLWIVVVSRRFGFLAAALTLAAVVVAAALPATAASPRPAESPQRWQLVWSDEFGGRDGAPPDPGKWAYHLGCTGWGNNELECYTRRPENVSLDGAGHLRIVALREPYEGHAYTSARIHTQGLFSRSYGRFEARMKIPSGQGTWPAFWMVGANINEVGWPACGEIDVMEAIGREPSTVYGSMHGPGYVGGLISTPYVLESGALADDFHLYAVEWSQEGIAWYIDGVRYAWKTAKDLPAGAPWVFDHPFFLILNLAIGGDWPGAPDASTVFPATLLVDYVRVYRRVAADTEAPGPPRRLQVVRRGASTLTIAWQAARDNVGVTRYDVSVGAKRIGSTTKTRFVLRGLKPATALPTSCAFAPTTPPETTQQRPACAHGPVGLREPAEAGPAAEGARGQGC